MAEVLIYNRVLSAAERDAVNSYLNSKYALVTNAPAGPTNLTASTVSPTQINLAWSNVTPTAGVHFYYVRVEQADGQLAWGSPMWIDYGK